MNEIRVKGFKYTSFWREDSIGVVVLKTDSHGFLEADSIGEIMFPLTTAVTDPDIETIVITGQNNYFCNGFKVPESLSEASVTLDSISGLSNLIFSLQKPVVSILNGHAKDFGYELALISDYIISSDENKVGFHKEYLPILGSSCVFERFRDLSISGVVENRNVDKIFPRDNLLGDSHDFIMSGHFGQVVTRRNLRISKLGNALNLEHLNFLRHKISALNSEQEVEKEEITKR